MDSNKLASYSTKGKCYVIIKWFNNVTLLVIYLKYSEFLFIIECNILTIYSLISSLHSSTRWILVNIFVYIFTSLIYIHTFNTKSFQSLLILLLSLLFWDLTWQFHFLIIIGIEQLELMYIRTRLYVITDWPTVSTQPIIVFRRVNGNK